jgi:hypothetical protein
VVRARVAGGAGTRQDLCRQRVRDHVLNDRSDHDQDRGKDVELVGTDKCEPAARSGGQATKPAPITM